MAKKLIRNEGQAKVVFHGGEIAPLQYIAIEATEAERLMNLFPFLVEVPSLAEVENQGEKDAEAFYSRRGRKKKEASELLK